ncbi:hypothetical protein [Methanocella arvoryzae]|uniref:Uncharacterized protein n=1 Tax=Methanocella arvoryzae (strain DSM 22066 / NBRC 105507 / MRE50) TaxID=351160 RepID=Q0W269_METAR|nr:hypothetical protein [Methanocella arvoryzae]CAJ37524.1 hypothetical protein RCIX2439 [Methanocella arvoryzae MRE50]
MPRTRVTRDTWTALARAFLIAVLMALVMMLMAFGFVYLLNPGASLPISAAVMLLAFALAFIAAAVLLQRTGAGQTTAIIGGAAIAMGFTIFVVTLCTGVLYLQSGAAAVETDTMVGGFAIALVASVIINQLTLKL